MSVSAIESGVGSVWQAKQSALGTIAAANASGTVRLRKTGDNGLKPAKTTASEEYVDGLSIGSPGVFVDSIGGEVGALSAQAQIETGGFIFAQMAGADTVTGTTPDYTHTIAFGAANGTYQTYRQEVGSAVGPIKQAWWDALINKLTWNCGQDQKVARITQEPIALKSAEWYTTSPTAADSGTDPFTWNEVTGAVTIDATAFNEIDGETLEVDRKLGVHRGDSASAVAFLFGKGEINRVVTALVSDNTIPVIKNALYGTTSPTAGTSLSSAPSYVALESTYTRSSVRSLKITTPKVQVNPADFEIYPRAEGGKIPISFGGRALKSGSTAALTVVAKTGDSTSYVA